MTMKAGITMIVSAARIAWENGTYLAQMSSYCYPNGHRNMLMKIR